ncbi:MAG: CoA transferase [Acidimicrobiales bacterium]|nr:CoA transferase [Acidimicrobiales bacterium]
MSEPGAPPLDGLRVIDLATVLAGPNCARYLADFGADVIKVEHPDGGDTLRRMAWLDPDDGTSLFFKLANRNKRFVTLDLRHADDLAVLRRLLAEADVLVENLRPGKLEALGLAPDDLLAANDRLVITRVTGFGQDGPYAHRAGFATLAEAMSGFAAVNGEPDGAPMLPPIALTDELTAIVAAFATMVAVHSGVGQVVDVNLLESMLHIMGPVVSAYDRLGYVQPRLGSGIPYTVPRNTYRTADGHWVAVSSSAESVAARVIALVGAGDDERFATFAGRVEHRAEVDALVAAWIAERTRDEVLAAFDAVEAAAAPVYDVPALVADPHLGQRQALARVDGVLMQGLIARLSATPGRLRHAGRPLGADDPDAGTGERIDWHR